MEIAKVFIRLERVLTDSWLDLEMNIPAHEAVYVNSETIGRFIDAGFSGWELVHYSLGEDCENSDIH